MAVVGDILSFNNPLYKTYLFYTCLLAVKVLCMAFLTGRQRFKKGAFANPEDATSKSAKVKSDDDVERVRRAHLNDLENIPVFVFVCGVYLLTEPSVFLATNLIRIFALARIMHTLVYAVVVIPQPARALAFFVGLVVTLYMAFVSMMKFAAFM